MRYKEYIKRKISYLLIKKENNFIKKQAYSYRGISGNKEKEIIVYIRNQNNKDKQQIVDFCKDKFNVLEQDAERLFYIAFPDGLDFNEESSLDTLDDILSKLDSLPKEYIDAVFTHILEKKTSSVLGMIDPSITDTSRVVIASLLSRRKLI